MLSNLNISTKNILYFDISVIKQPNFAKIILKTYQIILIH